VTVVTVGVTAWRGRTLSRIGRRLPAHVGALGKALLAERPDDDLPPGPYTPATPRTHTDRDALAGDLAAVRARGRSGGERRAGGGVNRTTEFRAGTIEPAAPDREP
jgi:DNA-binding IclR family transcriptional regulator